MAFDIKTVDIIIIMASRAASVLLLVLAGVVGGCASSEGGGTLRLKGGTGQGGPSRGFKSNGSGFRWRHPQTMSLRAVSKPFGKRPQQKLRNPAPFYKNQDMESCAPQLPKHLLARRLRDRTKFNVRNDAKGIQDLKTALEDPIFKFGFTGELDYEEGQGEYDWKDNIKLPRAFKVGRWGYGKPAYDFTNRYIGGPNQG